MQVPSVCILFELSNSLIQSSNKVLSLQKHNQKCKLISINFQLNNLKEDNDNNQISQINDQNNKQLLLCPKQSTLTNQINQKIHKKQLQQYQNQLAKELCQVLNIIKQKKLITVLFTSQLLSNFIQSVQKNCFFEFFLKISYKSQFMNLKNKELFTCLDDLKLKKQNCIFIADTPKTGQMMRNLGIQFYRIEYEVQRQKYSNAINTIKRIPSYVERFINKRMFIQTYKASFPKPNMNDFQAAETQHQADILKQFKKEPTCYLFNKIVILSKRMFSNVSYRQIQEIAMRQLMGLEDNQCLLQKIKESLDKNIQLNSFPSLAGKNIHHKPGSFQIEIKFPTYQKYNKYMKNYEICRKILNVPQVTNFIEEQLKVYQRFICKIEHTRTEQQCLEFVDLLKKINVNIKVGQLPTEKFAQFMLEMKENIHLFNTFVSGQRLNLEETFILIQKLQQLSKQIDKCAETLLYRDINLTNILRQSLTNKLFIVDFDNICYGPYILDLCFILTDKYYYFDDLIVDAGLHHYTSIFSLKYENVEKDFSYCCYFMCVRWLVKLTNCYMSNQISFHMNLKVLLVQLLRSFYRISKFFTIEEVKQQKVIIRKLIKGFLGGYGEISKLQNLPSLPDKVILLYGPSYSEISQISNILLLDCSPKPQIININQKLIQLRKKSIDKYYKINSTDIDYLFIFKRDQIKQLNIKIQPNAVNKILLSNTQQKTRQFKKWYQQTINQNNFIVCEVLLQILGKSDKVVIVQSHLKEVWEQLRVLLQGSTVLICNQLKQQLFPREITMINQQSQNNQKHLSLRQIAYLQKYNENHKQKQMDLFSQSGIAYNSKNVSLIKNYIMMSMQTSKYCAVILAAGQGSRFGYAHKALIQINGKSLLQIWIQKLLNMNITQIVIVDLKHREDKTIELIQSKFPKNLGKIKLVCQQKALGPGDTLMQGLQQVTKQKVFTISCDTFSNLPISQLQYDEDKVDGRILVDQSLRSGRYTLGQDSMVKMIQNNAQQEAVTYGGIGCFSRSKLLSFSNQNIELIKNFGDILTKYVKNFKLQGIKLEQNQYMHNINTQDDYNQACKIARGNV